jgi:hypothetical protein
MALTWWKGLRSQEFNNDPTQIALCGVLIEAAAWEAFSGVDDSSGVYLYVMSQGWPKNETIRRLDHAAKFSAAFKAAPTTLKELVRVVAKRVVGKL